MKHVLSLVVSALLAHAAAAETLERQAEAPPRGEVEIVNVSGEVRVIGWDRAQVQLRAELTGEVETVEFERDGDRTSIQVKWPRGRQHGGTADLTVHVPRQSTLMVNTVSASQRIENVSGEQRLQSVSGEIRTQVWGEDLDAKNVSGAIVVRGHGTRASIRATNVSGSITLDEVAGELDLNTVNGQIDVRGASVARAHLKSTNGETRLSGALAKGARIDAEAINGSILLDLRGPLDAEFNIETFNGSIDNCFGPEPQRTSKYAPGSALRFKEGQGSARVRLKTLNGMIELCRK